jgi:hypothetical protein
MAERLLGNLHQKQPQSFPSFCHHIDDLLIAATSKLVSGGEIVSTMICRVSIADKS